MELNLAAMLAFTAGGLSILPQAIWFRFYEASVEIFYSGSVCLHFGRNYVYAADPVRGTF